MLFGNKIVKIDVLAQDGSQVLSTERGFVFPNNIDSSDESILIIKGKGMPELDRGTRVTVITYLKAGERIKYAGDVVMSHNRQMNITLLKADQNGILEERRRYFKIKVELSGRALFVVRDEEAIRFEVPPKISIQDINVGGIFMKCDFGFAVDDCVCVEIELMDEYKLNTMARILRVQKNGDEVHGYGCAFENLTAAQEDAIGRYINQQQLLQRAKLNDDDEDEDI